MIILLGSLLMYLLLIIVTFSFSDIPDPKSRVQVRYLSHLHMDFGLDILRRDVCNTGVTMLSSILKYAIVRNWLSIYCNQ